MAKCPNCEKEIDKLISAQEVSVSFDFKLDKKDIVYFNRKEHANYNNFYYCPECSEEITNNENDAVKFLKGE